MPAGPPDDRATRGKTAPGRLARLDPWLAADVATWVRSDEADTVVDVGLGAVPDTTVELHRALRAAHPTIRTVGVELDPAPVAALNALDLDGLSGVVGGFGTPVPGRVGLVRAANLLRQYPLDQVPAALRALAGWFGPDGGLIVEGTTDKQGDRGVFRVLDVDLGDLWAVGLLVVVDPDGPFHPRALTAYLPRGLGWHGHPAPVLRPLFDAWTAAFDQARAAGRTDGFVATCEALSAAHPEVAEDPAGWAAGRLWIRCWPEDPLFPDDRIDLVTPHTLPPSG